jgi:hypothetical protein
MNDARNPPTAIDASASCVLWSRAGSPPPQALLRVLEQRRLALVLVTHRFHALTELALAQARIATEKTATGPRGPILVLLEPALLDGAPDVVRLASTYAPHALFWQYQAESSPKLGIYISPPAPMPAVTIEPARPTPILHPEPAATSPALARPASFTPGQPPLTLKLTGDPRPSPLGHTLDASPTAFSGRRSDLKLVEPESSPTQKNGDPDPSRVQLSSHAADTSNGSSHRPLASLTPRERPDFSRIITEDELTMLLADRDSQARP